jgi:hypothetical protein
VYGCGTRVNPSEPRAGRRSVSDFDVGGTGLPVLRIHGETLFPRMTCRRIENAVCTSRGGYSTEHLRALISITSSSWPRNATCVNEAGARKANSAAVNPRDFTSASLPNRSRNAVG